MDVNEYLDMVPTENARIIEAPEYLSDNKYIPSKFMRFMEAILNPVVDLQNAVSDYSAYGAREAVGDQLDMVGAIVGVDRLLPYIPSSGEQKMPDSQYSLAIQLRIAQESWDGMNETAANIYQTVVGDIINVSYVDEMDCTMTINTDVAGQEIAQIFSSTSEFLVPAGVDVDIAVNDEPSSVDVYHGIALAGIEYEIRLELGGLS